VARSAAALTVGVAIFLSKVAGLIRERVFAHYLGNTPAAGAFKAALRIPNLLQNLFGEGVLSASFIPEYARLNERDPEAAGRLAGVIGSLLLVVTSLLVAVGVTLAGPLTGLVAPGYKDDIEVYALTVSLVRIMFGGIGMLVLAAWCLSVLNSHRKFFLSYVTPVLWNAVQIAALVWFGRRLVAGPEGRAALAVEVAWATVVGAAVQLLVQLPAALRLVRGLRPSLRVPSGSQARRVVANFGPVVVGRGVVQLSAYLDQVLASYLGAPMVAAMAYAQQLYLLPISLFGMAISASELPEMARELAGESGAISAAAQGRLRQRVSDGASRLVFFVVPSVVAFLALGDVVVALLFQSGKFGADDTVTVWRILAGSTVGLVAATTGRLLSSCFYALGDTKTPLRLAIIRVTLTGVGGWALAFPLPHALRLGPSWGAAGLTAAAGLAGWLEFYLLRRALTRRIGPFPVGGRASLRAWAAALPAGGAAFALHHYVHLRSPIFDGLMVLSLYGALYGAMALLLGVPEARGIVRRMLRRR